jgi:hypothetical protein
MRGTYTNTYQTLQTQSTTLNNLQQQLRTLETNVNKYLKQNFDNVLTNIVRNGTQFDQFKTENARSAAELSKLSEANKTDIRKATKILKDNFVSEISTLKKDLSIDQEDLKEKILGMEDKVKIELSSFDSKSSEIIENIKTTLQESNDLMEGKLELISEKSNKLSSDVNQIENDLTEFIEDKMSKQRDILNNVLDDQQKITVSDLSEKISQQTNISKENFETQAEKLAIRVGDIHASMDERMNAISETVNSKLQEFQENYDNTFTKEMGDLKTQISSIRADIEIMKTLLANMAR